jgi:hypothetical protein
MSSSKSSKRNRASSPPLEQPTEVPKRYKAQAGKGEAASSDASASSSASGNKGPMWMTVPTLLQSLQQGQTRVVNVSFAAIVSVDAAGDDKKESKEADSNSGLVSSSLSAEPAIVTGSLWHYSFPAGRLRMEAKGPIAASLLAKMRDHKLVPLGLLNAALGLDDQFRLKLTLDYKTQLRSLDKSTFQELAAAAIGNNLKNTMESLSWLSAASLRSEEIEACRFLSGTSEEKTNSPRKGWKSVAKSHHFHVTILGAVNKIMSGTQRETCTGCKRFVSYCQCEPRPDTSMEPMVELQCKIAQMPVTLWLFNSTPLLQLLSMKKEDFRRLSAQEFQDALHRLQGAQVHVGATLRIGGMRAPYSVIQCVLGQVHQEQSPSADEATPEPSLDPEQEDLFAQLNL